MRVYLPASFFERWHKSCLRLPQSGRHRAHFKQHQARDRDQCRGEAVKFHLVGADECVHWINHICQPVYGDDGSFLGTRGSNRDITEGKSAQEALLQSARRIALGEMSAGLAHEINQPMTVISMLAEGLQEPSQVLVNLLHNARDALSVKQQQLSGADKATWRMQIGIRTRMEADTLVIEVEDNGTGVPEADRERLFDPFFTTKGPDKGTGLGLSISHAIVKDHGGQVDCQSQEGEGTLFTVRLPMVAAIEAGTLCHSD